MLSLSRQRVVVLISLLLSTAVFTFSLSMCISFSLLSHILQTRPRQTYVTNFYGAESTGLTTNISLAEAPLRSASSIQAYLKLTLPESSRNLEHPVFKVSATLHTADEVCVAYGEANAALRYRSSTARSIRAVTFWLPFLLGIMSEYQSVKVPLLHFHPSTTTTSLHRLSISLHAPLHVSHASVQLIVKRKPYLRVLWKQMPTIFVASSTVSIFVTMIALYCLLILWIIFNAAIRTMTESAIMRRPIHTTMESSVKLPASKTSETATCLGSAVSQTSSTTETSDTRYKAPLSGDYRLPARKHLT